MQFGWSLLFSGMLMADVAGSQTASVMLEWDVDPNVAGYRLYYGVESGSYPVAIDVGPASSCSVSNLVPGATYFFVATAYSHLGLESDFSSEIVVTPGPGVPGHALRIASFFADDHGTVLSWGSKPGTVYRVLATQTLSNPVWVDVSGPLLASSTTRLWTHMRPASVRSIFYRVEALSGAPELQ